MTLAEILPLAVAEGLELLACPAECNNGACPCQNCEYAHEDIGANQCPACDGTGEDRTPGGALLAVCAALPAGAEVRITNRGVWLTLPMGSQKAIVYEPHTGTPESIARAAVTAWREAQLS